MRRYAISFAPSVASKCHAPSARTIGNGTGHALGPTVNITLIARFANQGMCLVVALEKLESRIFILRGVPRRQQLVFPRPSICFSASSSFALTAAMNAAAAARYVGNVFTAESWARQMDATQMSSIARIDPANRPTLPSLIAAFPRAIAAAGARFAAIARRTLRFAAKVAVKAAWTRARILLRRRSLRLWPVAALRKTCVRIAGAGRAATDAVAAEGAGPSGAGHCRAALCLRCCRGVGLPPVAPGGGL